MRNYPQKIGAFCNRIKEWKQGMCQRDNNKKKKIRKQFNGSSMKREISAPGDRL